MPNSKDKLQEQQNIKTTENKVSEGNTNIETNSSNKNGYSIFKTILLILLLIFILSICFITFVLKPNWNYLFSGKLNITSITINNYNTENNTIQINVTTAKSLISNIKCYLSEDSIVSSDDSCISLRNNKCEFTAELKDYYIILRNENNRIIGKTKLTDHINKSFNLKLSADKIYLAIGAEKTITTSIISIGNIKNNITWSSSNNNVATVENGKITAIGDGTSVITATDSYGTSSTVNVVVSKLIDNYELRTNKELLKGTIYTLEEANLLDEILFARVAEAGEGTRAGAVAAARFLTLEFQYSIPYFFENGRVNSSGWKFVDGEGRYYHKGLYLHKSKFETIKASYAGPAIWGMPLTNYEDEPPYFTKYARLPNGLDCSGFVSWAILNGGFDPGDYGAGNTPDPNQITDLGEYTPITQNLLNSGKVKTGDLINYFGHIGMIIGIDGEDYYVAETLDSFRKLVVKKYTKARNLYPFSHIVLMDTYYKEDGNYTQMW